MNRTLLALTAALAILAAACGGSDEDEPSTTGGGEVSTAQPDATSAEGSAEPSGGDTPESDGSSDGAASGSDAPSDGAEPVSSDGGLAGLDEEELEELAGPVELDLPDPSDEDLELTASFRGVSADSIKLGISIFDLSAIGRDNGDVQAKYQIAIDAINDGGGVLGRRIEPVYVEFTPLDTATGDAACVQLTEDAEVFAVVGAQNADYVLCFTELHETIFLSARQLTAEQIARSNAPALSVAAGGDRLVRSGLQAMVTEGIFDGARVAVHASADGSDQLELARQMLQELGVEVVSGTVSTDQGGDLAAIRSEMSVFAQRWDADGADIVIAVGDAGNLEVATALGDAGLDMTMAATQPAVDGSVYQNFGAHLSGLEGAVATSRLTYADLYDRDLLGVRECVTRFEQASGEAVNLRPEPGEIANLTTTVWGCQLTELFAQIAAAAGPDLTNDSFQAAFESATDLRATGLAFGSGAPGKWSIDDSPPIIVTWDADAGDFVSR